MMNEKAKSFLLPSEVAYGATMRGNEYGWQIPAFADALEQAEALGYACLGGQFQFRVPDGTCEMYWLNSDATGRTAGESWSDYCHRSCAEVLRGFNRMIRETDFRAEASKWHVLSTKVPGGFDPLSALVFVACFVTEDEI